MSSDAAEKLRVVGIEDKNNEKQFSFPIKKANKPKSVIERKWAQA